MKYSPTTGNFYPDEINYGDALPDDAAAVPLSDYTAAMARKDGATIKLVGRRIAVYDAAPATFSDLAEIYLSQVRAKRELILNRLVGIGLAAQFNKDDALLKSVVDTRSALLNITAVDDVVKASEISALESAVRAEYARIISAAAEDIASAFTGVNL